MMRRSAILGMCTAALLLAAGAARADGDGPTRKMTAAEAAAFNALKTAFRGALPPAPEHYALTVAEPGGAAGFEVPQALAPDRGAWMTFAATYALSRDFQAGQQQAAFTDRAAGTPEQQAKITALEAKDAELTRARNAARGAEKERIRAELKAVEKEANAVRDQIMADYQAWVMSGGAMQAMQGAGAALPPKELTVRAVVNQDVSLSDKGAPYPLPGYPLAIEQQDGCQDPGTGCITVFLGTFEKEKRVSGYTRYNLRAAGPGVPTKPRGMALVVAGPKDKPQAVREFLAKVDLAKLKAQVAP